MAATPTPELQRAVRPEPDAPTSAPLPQLAAGVELIGKYEDSGFKEEPYIARRADGQVIQMPRLLYLVAESIDGRRGYADIAGRVSERARLGLDTAGAQMLVEEKLRPLGLVAAEDGSTPELPKADPLLALKMKTGVVPEGVVNTIARIFRPFFYPPVVLALLGAFFALDAWLFLVHGVAQSVRQTFYDPLFILLLLGLVVLSAAFHESGHATACAYGGARPGVMGVGIYIVWPAFYTDVTDAYRLGKRGRLRTDLGGVYFNAIFSIATFGVYFLTGWEPLLLVVPLQIMEMLHQFLPFIRLDGYYIVSDLTGVPDMFSRIKPTLKSLNPLDETPQEVRVLKPWVRVAVTAYVFTVVPLLLFLLGLTVINVPRVVATAWDSMLLQNLKLHDHVATHAYTHVAVDAIQMSVLVLPVAGLFVTFWKLGRTIASGLWSRTEGRRLARLVVVAGTAAALFGSAYTWLPNGDYRPIQAAERGTLSGALQELRALPGGRPSLTALRAQQLGGAPMESAGGHVNLHNGNANDATPTTSTGTTEEGGVTTTGGLVGGSGSSSGTGDSTSADTTGSSGDTSGLNDLPSVPASPTDTATTGGTTPESTSTTSAGSGSTSTSTPTPTTSNANPTTTTTP